MGYRTLEEKFITDYEHLEEENSSLRQKVKELESQLQKDSDGNFILDTMVNKAGRNKLFDDCTLYYAPRTLDGDKDSKNGRLNTVMMVEKFQLQLVLKNSLIILLKNSRMPGKRNITRK